MEICSSCGNQFDPEQGVSTYVSPRGYKYPCCSRECMLIIFKERYPEQVRKRNVAAAKQRAKTLFNSATNLALSQNKQILT